MRLHSSLALVPGLTLALLCADAAADPKSSATAQDPVRVSEAETPPPLPPSRNPPEKSAPSFDASAFLCRTLQTAAQQNGLPEAFLTRLIWQESRFEPRAVSPAGARGVAQFMPGTAAYLGLANPFDVTDAINTSAKYLRDLNRQFGNLGLAAAAYNAGPGRVQDWLDEGGGLPAETLAYVRIVTGREVEAWRAAGSGEMALAIPEATNCARLVKQLAEKPETAAPAAKTASARAVSATRAPWGLQLTGAASQAEALAAFTKMQAAYKTILGGYPPLVLRSRVGRNHSWYRVRVAVNSLFGAKRLCSDLRAAGGSCIVQAN